MRSRVDEGADDRTLLAAHVAGDPDAFGLLFRRHQDRLWAVALRTIGNPEDAADALQDAMISAHRRAGGFRGDAAVTTWLHRIVVNACLDRLRREKVRRAEPLPDDLDAAASRGRLTLATDAGSDPEQVALAGDRREVVLAALARLHPEQRAALALVDMEGYPVAQAAEILSCPPGTVKSRCARGRARLAELLRGTGIMDDASHPQQDPDPVGRARPAAEGATGDAGTDDPTGPVQRGGAHP